MATDRSTSRPTPNATAATWTYSPAVFPATVRADALRPYASARATMNITLGPGITMMMNAVTANAARSAAGILRFYAAQETTAAGPRSTLVATWRAALDDAD